MKSTPEMGEKVGLSTGDRLSLQGHDHDRVKELAYSYWLNEGKPEGRSHEHWRRAERALQSEGGAALFEEPHLTHHVDERLGEKVTKEKVVKPEKAAAKPRASKAPKSKETAA